MPPPPTTESSVDQASNRPGRAPELILGVAAVYWLFQVVWFWRYCGREINIDAVCYVGIARHITDGNFRASFHGYWSPLISWLIALSSLVVHDRTLAARVLMLPCFAVCLLLVHRLTKRLWGSRLLAAVAVLWFTAARGVAAFSVCFIGADLLLTAAVLAYFILLLRCLEQPDGARNWFALGIAHGVAFLAKAVAMPLFACATVLATVSSLGKHPAKAARNLVYAALIPVVIWAGWGMALRQKYGVFTSGYQLRWNLLDPAVRQASLRGQGLIVLHNTRGTYDSYMVTDAMAPGAPVWRAQVWRPELANAILRKEIQNVPEAIKQLVVLLTPGGVLALILCVVQLTRARQRCGARFRFVWLVLVTAALLMLAYCMLVFDARYVLPLTPVFIALAVRFALPPGKAGDLPPTDGAPLPDTGRWQTAAFVLLALGLLGIQVYWASPFRTIRQDFQQSVYNAADVLEKGQASTVVGIGAGPYPEHGVGWEAGIYAAYFSGSRVVGELLEVPPGLSPDSVVADVKTLAPDAVMLWGAPTDSNYSSLLSKLETAFPEAGSHRITDPRKGDVGAILLLRDRANDGNQPTVQK